MNEQQIIITKKFWNNIKNLDNETCGEVFRQMFNFQFFESKINSKDKLINALVRSLISNIIKD